MCGLAGIVDFSRPSREHEARLREMQRRLEHRGPDGEGVHFGAHCTLAHTRLAMLGSVAQPLTRGRYTLVYNGELFSDFAGGSDTLEVLDLWERHGRDCVHHLDGMFAFFVWDELEQRGFAARDRLGVKPLAFTRSFAKCEGSFAFASEARALLGGRRRPNVGAIVQNLAAGCFALESPFEGIEYLPPGSRLEIDREGVRVERWWKWQPRAEPIEALELRERFVQSVRGALRSDAPLGVFLSGGLDSTALAAQARLPAWTVQFDESEARSALVISDDVPHAIAAAAELGLEHHIVRVPRESLAQEIAGVAAANDLLPAWEQEIAQRALSRAASRQVKGILVGDAADELHYGYHFVLDLSNGAQVAQRVGSVPVRREVCADPLRELREERDLPRLVVERWLPRLLHNGDVHTMRFGLEARVPFASAPLVDLAMRAPPQQAMDKALLREALRGLMPEGPRLRRKSALPKDLGAQLVYQRELLSLDLHPLVRALVDLEQLQPLLHADALDEPQRAQLFRVLALHHWACAFEVEAP